MNKLPSSPTLLPYPPPLPSSPTLLPLSHSSLPSFYHSPTLILPSFYPPLPLSSYPSAILIPPFCHPPTLLPPPIFALSSYHGSYCMSMLKLTCKLVNKVQRLFLFCSSTNIGTCFMRPNFTVQNSSVLSFSHSPLLPLPSSTTPPPSHTKAV